MATLGSESGLTLLYQVWEAARRAGSIIDEALTDTWMTATDYAVYSLVEMAGPTTPTQLSELSGVPIQTMSRMLREMENRSHLDRSPNPADARSNMVSLSSKGLEARRGAAPAFREVMKTLDAHLGSDEEAVRWALGRLNYAMRQMTGDDIPDDTEETPTLNTVRYGGSPLTGREAREVRDYIEWLRHRDQARS